MQSFTPAVANKLSVDMVAKADGSYIQTGTVTVYLVADSGDNNGKWWKASNSTWSDTEVSAGAASFKGGCTWEVTVAAEAFVAGVKYKVYGKESGSLNVGYSETVAVVNLSQGEAVEITVESDFIKVSS